MPYRRQDADLHQVHGQFGPQLELQLAQLFVRHRHKESFKSTESTGWHKVVKDTATTRVALAHLALEGAHDGVPAGLRRVSRLAAAHRRGQAVQACQHLDTRHRMPWVTAYVVHLLGDNATIVHLLPAPL